VALIPATVSPFPVLGVWSADWLYMYDGGQAVWRNTPLTAELLERPPLFGATAIPLWLIRDGLPSFQVACAVAAASLLGAIRHTAGLLGGGRAWPGWLFLAAGSLFFLHHTATCWGKQLAAALIVAGVALMGQARR